MSALDRIPMVSQRARLLELLCDCRPHSTTEAATALVLDAQAIEQEIKHLMGLGLPIKSLANCRYRLTLPLFPLRVDKLRAHLGVAANRLQLCDVVDSTNSYLRRHTCVGPMLPGAACVAEMQSAGRGRQGRAWISTPYANLMLSIMWTLNGAATSVGGLSLACGVALARALDDEGVTGVGLKWPNDVLWGNRKLGGLLVESHPLVTGETIVIVGVGVNVYIGEAQARLIDQPWTDLASVLGRPPDRNRLVAQVIRRLQEMFMVFQHTGFSSFREPWERRHVYHDRHVQVQGEAFTGYGRIVGIGMDGALQLRDRHGQIRQFYSGEISLRPHS